MTRIVMNIELEEALETWELPQDLGALEPLAQETTGPMQDWNSTQGSSMLGSPERKWEVLPLTDWPLLGFPQCFQERKRRVRRYVTYRQAKRHRKAQSIRKYRQYRN